MKTEVITRASRIDHIPRRYERIPAWSVPPLLLLWVYGFAKLTGAA